MLKSNIDRTHCHDGSGRHFTGLKETMYWIWSKIGELSKRNFRRNIQTEFSNLKKYGRKVLFLEIPGGANKHFSLSILHWDKILPVWQFFEFRLGSKSFQSLQNHLQLHHWLHHRFSKIYILWNEGFALISIDKLRYDRWKFRFSDYYFF